MHACITIRPFIVPIQGWWEKKKKATLYYLTFKFGGLNEFKLIL